MSRLAKSNLNQFSLALRGFPCLKKIQKKTSLVVVDDVVLYRCYISTLKKQSR